MAKVQLWQGFVTEVYIDEENRLVSNTTTGHSHPDPDVVWRDVEGLLEKLRKRAGSFVESGICPTDQHRKQASQIEKASAKVLN